MNKYFCQNTSLKVILFVLLTCLLQNTYFAQSASVTEGCAPLTVNFSPPAGSPSHYWDFKDGATATLSNPSNTFVSPGSYLVEYKNSSGGAIVGTVQIDVYPKPSPTFSMINGQGCAPLLVDFTNTTVPPNGVSITGYSWVLSNGATLTGANPSYSFSGPGSYGVSLSITTNLPSCNSTQQYLNVISASNPPNVNFSTTPFPASSCTAPLSVSFSNTSFSSAGPLTYNWDFGNGNTSTLATPPSQNYTSDGTYNVVLTATDTNGCENSKQIIVGVGQPEASFSIPNDTVCINTAVQLTNLSPAGTYSWTIQPGASPTSSSNTNPVINFTTPGYHDITLSLLGACPDDTTMTIFVEEIDATFTSSPTFSCEDPYQVNYTPNNTTGDTYSWTFGNDSISDLVNPTNIYTNADTNVYSVNGPQPNFYYSTTLTITSEAGCTGSFTSIDTLHEPNARIIPDIIKGCLPLTVVFNDSSASFSNIVDWEWHFGEGTVLNVANDASQSFTYNDAGVYNAFIIITNQNGCKDTSYLVPIFVGDVLTPDFSTDASSYCLGDSIYFTDLTAGSLVDSIDAWHYYAEGNRLFHCFEEPNPVWAFNNETGPQDITLMLEFNGCFSETTKTGIININGPLAEIYYHNECDSPNLVTFVDSTEDVSSVLWDFGDGDISTLLNPAHVYATSGDYTVTLIAVNTTTGCPNDTAVKVIQIRNINVSFENDSTICQSTDYSFDAINSVDVNEECHHGYTWYFSDPTMRPYMTDNPSPSFNFNQSGLNDIMLIGEDVNGCKDTLIHTVNVYGIIADFSKNLDTICLSNSIDFIASATSDTTITQWTWDFGDGSTSNTINPTHLFNSATNAQIPQDFDTIITSLTVDNILGCSDTYILNTIVYKPTSTVTASDYYICSGTEVFFNATDFTTFGSNLSFDWDFSDGNTSTIQNPSNTFNGSGTYPVSLNYEEIASGCQGSKNINITVKDYPIANFSTPFDNDLYLCPNENVLFTDLTLNGTSNMTYNWNFGNGSNSNFSDPGAIFTTNGVYNVQLITNIPAPYSCADTIIKTYTVQAPYGNFFTDLGDDTICRLESVLFTLIDTTAVDVFYWDFGDGTGAGAVSPVSHQYTFVPPSGMTVAKLIMTNSDGSCPFTQDTLIHIYEVVADFIRNGNDIDTALCPAPFPFTNASTNANIYNWNFGDGTNSNIENPADHNFPGPGTYTVTLGVENSQLSCTDTISKEIIIFSEPIFNALGDTICFGDIGNLQSDSLNATWTYTWSNDDGIVIDDPSLYSTTSSPLQNTQYSLFVVDTNGCSSSDIASIVVIPQPSFPDFDTTIVMGDSIYLPLIFDPNLYTLTWTPDTGLSCLNCPNPIVQPLEEITYYLTISDNFGCFSNDVIYHIDIFPETFINMPTTFTPNGDGVNDEIFVVGWGIKDLLEYKIFNRWGELIFETSDINVGWNGYHQEVLQNNDVYVVQVKALTWSDEEKTYEGYINLMR